MRALGDDILEWKRELIAASRSKQESMLITALRQVAWTEYDPDLIRLVDLYEAAVRGFVASRLSPDLPNKPGMASAYAISTIANGGWSKGPDGTWKSDKPLRWGHEHDPVEAGKTWRKRLLKKVRLNQKNGHRDDRDELIVLIFRAIDIRKL